MTDSLTLLDAVPAVFSAFVWKNVRVTLWFGPPTVESLVPFEQLTIECRQRFPQRMSHVHIMVPGRTALPSSEARKMFKRMDDEYGDLSVASAVVILGDGFFASAIRSLVMALGAVRPQAAHRKIHASVDEVAEWLPEFHRAKTGVELPPDELLRVLREAQATPPT